MTSKSSDLISEKPPRKKNWRLSRSDTIFVGIIFCIGALGAVGISQWGPKKPQTSPNSVPKSNVAQTVNVSRVTGINVPTGAKAMIDEAIVKDSANQLQARATQIAPNLEIEKLELLIWPNTTSVTAPKPSQILRNQSIRKEVTSKLKAEGYLYQQTQQNEKSVYEFVAVSQSAKLIVPGFWLESDEFLLLAWASFRPTK